jgi:hypothetical protein
METLLGPSTILLFGRVVQDLVFAPAVHQGPGPDGLNTNPPQGPNALQPPPPRQGRNNFLQRQLADPNATLARIYGFSYEGHYYDLPRPAIFLVHGPGTSAELSAGLGVPWDRLERTPADIDRTGVAGTEKSSSLDIKVWSYDKGDFSVRFDTETGPLEQILLEAALVSESSNAAFSGAHTRLSGAHTRLSGAHTRLSGAHVGPRNSRRGDWSD